MFNMEYDISNEKSVLWKGQEIFDDLLKELQLQLYKTRSAKCEYAKTLLYVCPDFKLLEENPFWLGLDHLQPPVKNVLRKARKMIKDLNPQPVRDGVRNHILNLFPLNDKTMFFKFTPTGRAWLENMDDVEQEMFLQDLVEHSLFRGFVSPFKDNYIRDVMLNDSSYLSLVRFCTWEGVDFRGDKGSGFGLLRCTDGEKEMLPFRKQGTRPLSETVRYFPPEGAGEDSFLLMGNGTLGLYYDWKDIMNIRDLGVVSDILCTKPTKKLKKISYDMLKDTIFEQVQDIDWVKELGRESKRYAYLEELAIETASPSTAPVVTREMFDVWFPYQKPQRGWRDMGLGHVYFPDINNRILDLLAPTFRYLDKKLEQQGFFDRFREADNT